MGSPGTDFRGARDAVWGSTLPALPRLVALRMVEHLPNVTPSTESLARHTGLSRATVIRCIKDLEIWGCLQVTRRNGCRSSYQLTGHWDQLPPATGVTQLPVSDGKETGVPQPSPPVAHSNPKQTREADKEAANVGASSSESTKPTRKRARRARPPMVATSLPDDFAPAPADREFARQRGLDIEAELYTFRRYYGDVTHKNWPGRWANWLRKADPARPPNKLRPLNHRVPNHVPSRPRERSAEEALRGFQ